MHQGGTHLELTKRTRYPPEVSAPQHSTMSTNNALISPELRTLWTQSDQYHNSFLIKPDAVLDEVQENTKAQGIEYDIAVSPALAKFIHILLLSIKAKRVLEVGSLGAG
ncbi:hypothetical protein MKEN_00018000 [Mycena kentingensis (nom. inval.)]|nr:hypothetical protein MKEN_00018000 [Mycena kentingensis (nom. inval.)]